MAINDNEKNEKSLRFRIVLASCFILVLFISALLAIFLTKGREMVGSCKAYIYSDGELIKVLNLDEEPDSSFDIVSKNGGVNTLTIKNHDIRVEKADCPDGLCVKCGFARGNSLPIVCLPHKLVIEIREISGKEEAVDAVTY